jgi:predicted nucleotidyltransferase
LIEFKGRKSLFDMAGLKIDLEKQTNKKVDLLTYRAVHPYLKKSIEKDVIKIYG